METLPTRQPVRFVPGRLFRIFPSCAPNLSPSARACVQNRRSFSIDARFSMRPGISGVFWLRLHKERMADADG